MFAVQVASTWALLTCLSILSIANAFSIGCSRPASMAARGDSEHLGSTFNRREWMAATAAAFSASGLLSTPAPALADGVAVSAIEMKEFVDPQGFFSVRVPDGFYTLRRSAKGDLPDAKGKGRRGSSIFTAGNMAKAEVISVDRFPTSVLLEENGIEATGSLKTFPNIGEPAAVATLINARRERDRPGTSSTVIIPDSLKLSADGQVLMFALRTEIEVQKPELLLEQTGVSQLFRITAAKATLRSSDGNMMAIFASALEQDYNGPDGKALEDSVDSFVATEREFGF